MNSFQPINKSRIEVVDALRGFALFGVIFANVPYGDSPAIASVFDDSLHLLSDLFISKKFITIFSILFGFGFYIQMSRAKAKEVKFKSYFTKRMALLFLIGTLHCYVIWNGDIIMSYAFGGMFLLLIKDWSLKRLLILAVFFNVVLTGIFFIGNSAFDWQAYNYDYNLAISHPITESYWEYLRGNAIMAPWTNFLKDMPITLTYTFGNMLIGVILGKLNFFQSPFKLKKLTNSFIVIGFTLGLFASYAFHQVSIGAIELDLTMLWVPFALAAGMILQALGYIALFIRLFKINFFNKILMLFRYVGKTALSNYIAQSLLYVFVFFHCINTLGLFGKITQAETYLIAFFFFILQSLISYFWLKKHEQGPLEYWWKKMSYKTSKK